MSNLLYTVAVAGLSLSGLAAAIRLIEWLIRTDPKLIAQTGRWAAVGLAILSLPLLLALLINEKWTAAMALAAMMLLAFAWHGPRLLQRLTRDRFAAGWSPPPAGNLTPAYGASVEDPDLVRRSIAVLEDYLRRTAALPGQVGMFRRAIGMQHSGDDGSTSLNGDAQHRSSDLMSEAEALDILGLGADASEMEIREAHRNLQELLSPERGGSQYLRIKIDQARSVLLSHTDESPEAVASARLSRAPQRRNTSA
jgi:hypothetical protein